MKKVLFLIALFIGIQFDSIAQQAHTMNQKSNLKKSTQKKKNSYENQGNLRVGFFVGAGASVIRGNEVESSTPKTEFNFGADVDMFILNKNLALNTGLQFSNLAANYIICKDIIAAELPKSGTTNCNQLNISYRNTAINVPVGVKLRSNAINNKFKFFGQLGINNSFTFGNGLTVSKDVLDNGTQLQGQKMNVDNTTYNPALKYGVGFEFYTGQMRTLSLGLNFQNGLKSISKTNDVKSSTYGIQCGFYF